MKIIYNKIFWEHDTGDLPENKKRLGAFSDLEEQKIINGERYLNLIHSRDYINSIKNRVGFRKFLDSETLVSEKSYEVACLAVGASIMAAKTGDFALIRPPGHHAGISRGAGFCLFNNIAIATQKLANDGKKVFILDFDGHFGNGTSEIFYKSTKVLYLSTHQYPAYPGTGGIEKIGEGKGKGYNINITFSPESGDDLFLWSIKEFLPIAKQFKPDIVGVSAGFDGHWADPLLELRFSANSYYEIGKILSENFKNVFAVLEGGYNTDFLPKCVYNFIAGINRQNLNFKESETNSHEQIKINHKKRIKKLKEILSKYWRL